MSIYEQFNDLKEGKNKNDPDSDDEPEIEYNCIIIDDFEFSNLPKIALTNLSSIFRFVSSHHNFSIIVCYQSFFCLKGFFALLD